MKLCSRPGFTLVELMIVIAVIGILSAIAIPNYQTYMAQRRLKGAARQVMSDFMAARMKAITQNNRFKVLFLNNHSYLILDDDNNNNAIDGGEATQTKDIQTDYYDVTFIKWADPIFYPRGTAWGATITVTNGQGAKYVKVAATGRVRIDDTP